MDSPSVNNICVYVGNALLNQQALLFYQMYPELSSKHTAKMTSVIYTIIIQLEMGVVTVKYTSRWLLNQSIVHLGVI